jgi:uncharacterized protein with NRDE domain
MCLIFLSINNHPKYKLIVAANRDEFYQRKTAPVHFWEDHPNILGGRDLEASGTWMAMSRNGKISLVTNYRDLHNINPNAPSRGKLVSDFLLSEDAPMDYLKKVEVNAKAYNGFNLIVGNPDELYYLSNYKGAPEKLEDGLHGLSNHLLDTPWPKVERGKQKMKDVIHTENVEARELFDLLYDDLKAEDALLPDTGVGLERERMLSPMFIKSPNYGTRCSTVVRVTHTNEVSYAERVYDLQTFQYTSRSFEFKIA